MTAHKEEPTLIIGVDYTLEDGLYVFTAAYHRKRGYCCGSKCRHCPYDKALQAEAIQRRQEGKPVRKKSDGGLDKIGI